MGIERLPEPSAPAPTPEQAKELGRLVELIRRTARNMRSNLRRVEQRGANGTTYTIRRQLAVLHKAADDLVSSPGFNSAQHGQVIELVLRLEQRANDALRRA
jgi:hypothetical protein